MNGFVQIYERNQVTINGFAAQSRRIRHGSVLGTTYLFLLYELFHYFPPVLQIIQNVLISTPTIRN